MPRAPHAVLVVLLLAALSGCAGLPVAPTAPPAAPQTAAPSVEPTREDTSTTAPLETPVPAATQGPPPALDTWPLAADLFVLNDTGQVWRQPYDGGRPDAVTPADMVVHDFAPAPGGEWLLLRTDDAVLVASAGGGRQTGLARGLGPPESAPTWSGGHGVAWSPDAERMAFAVPGGFEIVLPGTAGREPLVFPVTESAVADLSWSPDGTWLVVTRADSTAALYQIDPLLRWVELGGLNGHTWLADGRLAFAPTAGGLTLLAPGDAESRVFLVPQDRQATLPVQRSDGTLAFFLHSAATSEPGFLHVGDPDELTFRVASSQPVRTGTAIWEPGGTRLLLRAADGSELTLLDPETGGSALLESATGTTAAWGGTPARSVSGMRLPADLYYLAPVDGIAQVWRLPASGQPPQPVTAAAADVTSFDMGTAGEALVYASERQVWLVTDDPAQPLRLGGLYSQVTTTDPAPALSPDGTEVAYANGGIWIVDTGGLNPLRYTVDRVPTAFRERRLVQVYDDPRWSPEGGWLLVTVSYYEGSDLALIPPPDAFGRRGDPVLLDLVGAVGEWGADGRVYAYSDGSQYGDPYLAVIEPGSPPTVTRLLDLPVTDVTVLPANRLAFLRASAHPAGGPAVVRPYSAGADGRDLSVEYGAVMLENAALSPDGTLAAGLIRAQVGDDGRLTGQLALAELESGRVFAIEDAANVQAFEWGAAQP